MIRLIASDVDGTLLQKGQESLSEELFDVIRKATDRGVIFCIASGRPYEDLKKLFRPVVGRVVFICHDGALIMHKNCVVHKGIISRRVVSEFCSTADRYEDTQVFAGLRERTVLIKGEGAKSVSTLNEDVIKLSFYCKKGSAALLDSIGDVHGSGLRISYFDGNWVELIDKNSDKGEAVKIIQRRFGVSTAESAAFGDNDNDIPMLWAVGLKYATLNAKPILKEEAEHYTDDVVKTIKKILSI